VATGAPPIVDGVIADAKSHARVIRMEAIQLMVLSARILIFAAEK